jgi:hypothetical protein
MSNYNLRPVRLDLKPSYLLATILISAAMGACVVAVFVPMPFYVRVGLVIAVIISAVYHVMDLLLYLPQSIVRIDLTSKGQLRLKRKDSVEHSVEILPSSYVMPKLTILNIKTGSLLWRRSVVITPDRVDRDEFRRLRVWLRWGRHAISAEAAVES